MNKLVWTFTLLLLCPAWTCVERYQPKDASAVDAGPKPINPPKDTVFSIGIWNNSGGAPQSAAVVNLLFGTGSPDDETVVAARAETPPVLDGDASEWDFAPTSAIAFSPRGTVNGLSEEDWIREYTLLGGMVPLYDFGITSANVRAAYDDDNVYFVVQWRDDTEDRFRDEWSYDGIKWNRARGNEDKLSFSFDIDGTFRGFSEIGCAAACHIKTRLGDVSDAGRAHRFRMHTARVGELADVWVWRASTTNPTRYADDAYWDETGRKGDGLLELSTSNTRTIDGGMLPAFMSETGINANPTAIFKDDAGTPRAVAFDDTGVVAGTKLPGYVMQRASPERSDVRAVGRWNQGLWTVEISRVRESADPKDTRFLP